MEGEGVDTNQHELVSAGEAWRVRVWALTSMNW